MVDIVIVTYSALSKLRACLESVRRHTPASLYRLYIINNGSTDGTRKYLNQLRLNGCNVFHLPKNLGFSGGANYAAKQIRSPYVLFLDDDARATKGWLSGLLNTANKSKNIGMVGCKLVYPDCRIFYCEARLGPIRTLFAGDFDRGQADYMKEVDLIAGACFLVPRAILKKIGPFDETFFPSQAEDWDYCLRIRRAGHKIIYDGSVTVIHDNLFRAGGEKVNELNKKRFMKKWGACLAKEFPRADSHRADRIMSQAIAALKAGDNHKALQLSNKLKASHPKLVELWVPALANVRLCNYREAVGTLQEIITRNPNNYSARNYLTLCLRQLGIKETAEDFTDKMFACVSRNIKLKRNQPGQN